MKDYSRYTLLERCLALFAGFFNLAVGFGFFFMPETQIPLWPEYGVSDVMARYIGAIILGNAVGALCLATQTTWIAARALVLVATAYGTLVAGALTFHIVWRHATPIFWFFVAFDIAFLIVFYIVIFYHEVMPRIHRVRVAATIP